MFESPCWFPCMWGMVLPYLPLQLAWFQTFCSKSISSPVSETRRMLCIDRSPHRRHFPWTGLPVMLECAQPFLLPWFQLPSITGHKGSEAGSGEWPGLLSGARPCVPAHSPLSSEATWQWHVSGAGPQLCKKRADGWFPKEFLFSEDPHSPAVQIFNPPFTDAPRWNHRAVFPILRKILLVFMLFHFFCNPMIY